MLLHLGPFDGYRDQPSIIPCSRDQPTYRCLEVFRDFPLRHTERGLLSLRSKTRMGMLGLQSLHEGIADAGAGGTPQTTANQINLAVSECSSRNHRQRMLQLEEQCP